MTTEKYMLMCEQLGKDPDPEEMPIDFEDFPYIVQNAINIHTTLPDVWEGMSGTYMGKDYGLLPYLIDEVYKVEDRAQILKFIFMIDRIVMNYRAAEQKRKQQKNKRKK